MNAKVFVDTKNMGPKIDPKIFGHFLENMAKSLYGGGFLGSDGKPRGEAVKALDEMRVSCLRWPGGLFADGYHWEDGIGPDRPVRPNRFWKKYGPWIGPKDPNHFGTDEFLSLCAKIKADPYININLATGSAKEAADWVQYCNGAPDTPFGKNRAENGRRDPWGVKTWGIGNEQFGYWAYGHSDPAGYAKRYLEFHRLMREQDPGITPVVVGTCDMWPNWNPIVLSRIEGQAAYLSFHVYLPSMNKAQYLLFRLGGNAQNHYSLASAYLELDRKISFVAGQMRDVLGENHFMKIALDEWNLWWWFLQIYQVFWRMRDAVAVAGMAGSLVDHCDIVGMANLAQAFNVLGLLQTNEGKIVKTPPYYVMQLYASTLVGGRIPCKVSGPSYFSKKLGAIPAARNAPMVSAHAAATGERAGITLIQRRYEGPMRIEVECPGYRFKSLRLLGAEHPDARNTFENPDAVGVKEMEISDGAGGFSVELPATGVAAAIGEKIR